MIVDQSAIGFATCQQLIGNLSGQLSTATGLRSVTNVLFLTSDNEFSGIGLVGKIFS